MKGEQVIFLSSRIISIIIFMMMIIIIISSAKMACVPAKIAEIRVAGAPTQRSVYVGSSAKMACVLAKMAKIRVVGAPTQRLCRIMNKECTPTRANKKKFYTMYVL